MKKKSEQNNNGAPKRSTSKGATAKRAPSRATGRKQVTKTEAATDSTSPLTADGDQPETRLPDPLYIVGIGASAGGLEALRTLFGAMTAVKHMCFVVVQHLAPQHRSRLVELIGHSTLAKVREVQDGQALEPGIIYVTPPNHDVLYEEGRLRLKEPHLRVGPKPSIDLFFRSLAKHGQYSAIGIILSGTGTDGAQGVRAIKAEGGLTMCQKIESAKYDGMPKAAKLTGLVDLELTPEEIATELSRIDQHERTPNKSSKSVQPWSDDPYLDVLDLLDRFQGANFKQYKPATIRRRIERRMGVTECMTLPEYIAFMRENPDEAQLLFQDILISVTAFLRDRDAFDSLQSHLSERLATLSRDGTFRCWVAGCATGEEAYSIAILLMEVAERLERPLDAQIFATDLDEQALGLARKGLYPCASFANFPKTLLNKYFIPIDDRFQVKPILRDRIVFAKHNLISDPPFLNLDLITCRNVLIYFDGELQEKVLRTFHYSLRKSGLLFLGKSESASSSGGLFELADKHAKIFSRVNKKGELPHALPKREISREAALTTKQKRDVPAAPDFFKSLIEKAFQNAVLTDDEYRVQHIFGGAGRFLGFPAGEATQNLTRLVVPELSLELSALLLRANNGNKAVQGRVHLVSEQRVQLVVVPLTDAARAHFLVAFQEASPEQSQAAREGTAAPVKGANEDVVRRLEQELAATREHLQAVIEEQETSNEELQSLNEELQSANEELQSSNEELETTNEELQSSNEELTTLNQELNVKTAELQALNHRLSAIQGAIVYPLIIVDRKRYLTAFNPAARHLLRLSEGDIGVHIKAIEHPIDLDEVIRAVDESLINSRDQKLQFKTFDRSFEVQIQLFRGVREEIEGAVISFVDNTEIVNMLEMNQLNRAKLAAILENTPAFVTMKDLSGVYTYVNRRFGALIGRPVDDVIGLTDTELFGPLIGGTLREHDIEVIKSCRIQEFTESFEDEGRTRVWLASRFPLFDAKGRVQSICTVSLDVTDRVEHERQLELFRAALSAATSGIALFAGEDDHFTADYVSAPLAAMAGGTGHTLLGVSPKELLGRLTFAAKPDELKAITAAMQQQESYSTTLAVEGGDVWRELKSSLIELGSDEQKHLILTFFDASERVATQRILAQQQEELAKLNRFSVLGEISAGIAHEVSTPLNVITTKTDLLRTAVAKEKLNLDLARGVAQDIEQMVKNISAVVMGLRSMAGLSTDKHEAADLGDIVRDTLHMCEFRLQRQNIDLELDLPRQTPQVECYRIQIIQVLINLINNAIDAVSEQAGRRWIRVAVTDLGARVRLAVTDSGPGIDADLAEKIMTPFFTTKKSQDGTGIGLSLSRAIARRHGGELYLDQANPHTSFLMELPKNDRPN